MILFVILFLLSSSAYAEIIVPPLESQGKVVYQAQPQQQTMPLSALDQKALQMAKQSTDGETRLPYGMATVVCAPLHLTDIRLQPGEALLQVDIGDASRWKVATGQSGQGDKSQSHVLVKPTESDLHTSMTMLTTHRTYVLTLISKSATWMPIVSFAGAQIVQTPEIRPSSLVYRC